MDSFTAFLGQNKIAFLYISTAIGFPSTLLYCAECWTILWHKPFHNSFFKLFAVRASVDLICTFNTYFFNCIPGFFPEWFFNLDLPNWLFAFSNFCGSYTFCFDNLAMAFILINRLTAIVRPVNHENIWRKFMFPTLLIVYGVPLYSVTLLGIKLQTLAEKDAQGRIISIYSIEENNATTVSTHIAISAIFSILFSLFCIPINVAILWAYRRHHRKQQVKAIESGGVPKPAGIIRQTNAVAKEKAKADLIERRLLIFAVTTFFGHFLISLHMIIAYMYSKIGNVSMRTLVRSLYPMVMDLGFVVLPSWLLLWASPSFRRQLLAMFLPSILYTKIFGIPNLNNQIRKGQTATVMKINVTIRKPLQIASIRK